MKSEASNGEARTDEDEARFFNEFSAASVVTDEDYALFEPSRRHLYGRIEVAIGEAGKMAELKKLDPNKSQGIDSVPPILLKKIGGCISTSFKNLFNKIKRRRKFPTAWKIGIVSPIFEDGDRKEVSNYRPVTFLNIFLTFRNSISEPLLKLSLLHWAITNTVLLEDLLLFSYCTAWLKSIAKLELLIPTTYLFCMISRKLHLLAKLLQLDISKRLFELVRDYMSGRVQNYW